MVFKGDHGLYSSLLSDYRKAWFVRWPYLRVHGDKNPSFVVKGSSGILALLLLQICSDCVVHSAEGERSAGPLCAGLPTTQNRLPCGSGSKQECEARSCCLYEGACYHSSHKQQLSQKDVVVHLFEWRWVDVALECERYLGPMGYKAVQVSPAQEDKDAPNWWSRYQPVSYKLDSRSGSVSEFAAMVARCRAAGVGVIADVVLNHMADSPGDALQRGRAGTRYSNHAFEGLYSCNDFHHNAQDPGCGNCQAYPGPEATQADVDRIQRCDLGLPDLDTSSPYVRGVLSAHLNKLASMGVAGFRFDAAKHMNVNDLAAIFDSVERPAYASLEIVQFGDNLPHARDYDSIGSPWEFKTAQVYNDAFKNSRDLSKLAGLDSNSCAFGCHWADGGHAVSFIVNHDQLVNPGGRAGSVTMFDEGPYSLAAMVLLAHPYGQPTLLSSTNFIPDPHADSRVNDRYEFGGIPIDPDSGYYASVYDSHNRSVNCGYWRQPQSVCGPRPRAFLCEHRWPELANMVGWRQVASEDWASYSAHYEHGNQVMSIAYPGRAFLMISILQDPISFQRYNTVMPPGEYCDIRVAECYNPVGGCLPGCPSLVRVASDGTADLTLGTLGAVAFHRGSMLEAAHSES